MSLTVRSGTRRSMRIVSNKASYETMSSVAEKLMEISKMEGTIYRILTLSNKTYLASKLGIVGPDSIKKYRTGILISESWLRYSIRSSTSRIKIGLRVRLIGLRGIGL